MGRAAERGRGIEGRGIEGGAGSERVGRGGPISSQVRSSRERRSRDSERFPSGLGGKPSVTAGWMAWAQAGAGGDRGGEGGAEARRQGGAEAGRRSPRDLAAFPRLPPSRASILRFRTISGRIGWETVRYCGIDGPRGQKRASVDLSPRDSGRFPGRSGAKASESAGWLGRRPRDLRPCASPPRARRRSRACPRPMRPRCRTRLRLAAPWPPR